MSAPAHFFDVMDWIAMMLGSFYAVRRLQLLQAPGNESESSRPTEVHPSVRREAMGYAFVSGGSFAYLAADLALKAFASPQGWALEAHRLLFVAWLMTVAAAVLRIRRARRERQTTTDGAGEG